jgi:hypothetical protein
VDLSGCHCKTQRPDLAVDNCLIFAGLTTPLNAGRVILEFLCRYPHVDFSQ